jgi:hypothetical protein
MINSREYYYNINQETFGNSSESIPDIVEDQTNQNYTTSGSTGYSTPTINLSVSKIILKLSEEFQHLKESQQKDLFLKLLLSLHKVLIQYYTQSFELSHLPSLHVVIVEDGSILIEWIFTDFRIGFSIEVEITESSWYLVSNEKLENISKSGFLTSDKLDSVIDDVVGFIIENT